MEIKNKAKYVKPNTSVLLVNLGDIMETMDLGSGPKGFGDAEGKRVTFDETQGSGSPYDNYKSVWED